MKKYKVTLGNPCTFGWQNMSQAEKGGRHCSQCDKTVVDFTTMTDEQVIQYLLTHKNVCGHFNQSQLGRTMILHAPKRKKIFHWPSIAAMLVAGVFQCMPSHLQAQQTITAVQPKSTSILRDHQTTKNKTVPEQKTNEDSLVTIKVKVVDGQTKKPVSNAQLKISGVWSHTTNKKGDCSFTVLSGQIPEYVQVEVMADGYYYFHHVVDLKTFTKTPFYQVEIWYNDPNQWVDGGEIYIEPN